MLLAGYAYVGGLKSIRSWSYVKVHLRTCSGNINYVVLVKVLFNLLKTCENILLYMRYPFVLCFVHCKKSLTGIGMSTYWQWTIQSEYTLMIESTSRFKFCFDCFKYNILPSLRVGFACGGSYLIAILNLLYS